MTGRHSAARVALITGLATASSPSIRVIFRPTKLDTLLGDARKARDKLGWKPKTFFKELVVEMVQEDLKAAERDELVKKHGYPAYDYHE